MVRHYFACLAVCSVLTGFMAIPGMALMVMFVTLGLTYPLLFILPMTTILLWALLPAVKTRNSWLRWPALALGMALPLSLMLLPGKADREAQQLIEAKGPVAAQPASFSRPSGVEIIRNVTHNPDFYSFDGVHSGLYGEAPCFDICERLLTGGDVAWVRIVLRDDAFANDKAETSARFVLAKDANCHALNSDFPAEGSTCISFSRDDGQQAALVLDLQDDRVRKDQATGAWPLEEIGYRTATAHAGDSTDGPILFRGVQLFYERPNGLVVLDPGDFNGDVGGGFALWRTRSVTPPIDLAAAITGLGLAMGPPRPIPPKTPGTETKDWIGPPPDAQDAVYVASLLALGLSPVVTPSPATPCPNTGCRSNAFAQVVTGWQGKLQWKKPITEADRVILCASLQDTFISTSFWAVQLQNNSLRCD